METKNLREEFDHDIVANINFDECSLDPEDLFEWIQWQISLAENNKVQSLEAKFVDWARTKKSKTWLDGFGEAILYLKSIKLSTPDNPNEQ